MKIDLNKTVFDIIKDSEKIKSDLIDLGFKGLENPLMLKTMAKKISLNRAARMMGVGNIRDKLEDLGYEVLDSSKDLEVLKRRKLLKFYIKRLTEGEDLESVRADFRENFSKVSAAGIMDAEEELLASGMDKEKVRKLCDVHSSLFHERSEEEIEKTNYDDPLLGYFSRENQRIKELLEKLDTSEISKLRGYLSGHYRKKGDLLYPVLKAKYNKPGPSDIMWAVDIEIVNNLKKAIKLKDDRLMEETLKRAEEMTYKEENILYPLVFENFSKEDLELIYDDLGDYDHDLVNYAYRKKAKGLVSEKDGYIEFSKGRLSLKELRAMLDTLEIELTFVDKDDINSYYNDPKEKKAFKRPASSLGRKVYSCHPPQAEPIVRGLIGDFKKGNKDSFKLVKTIGDSDYAIGYYAVRDEDGAYLGVLETVQDLSFYRKYLG